MRTILFILALATSFNIKSDDILWLKPNFPPANFVSGLLHGLGYYDRMEEFIINRMDKYEHGHIVAGYGRILNYLKQRNGCAVGLIRNPERESFLAYSEVALLVFPNGVITRRDNIEKFAPHLNEDGRVMAKSLMKDTALMVGIAEGRIYDGVIDEIYSKSKNKPNIITRRGEDVLSGLISMLDLGRIDLTFGYPVELEYHLSLGVLKNEMVFLQIQEMPKFIESHVVCRNNAWGQGMIREIDKILLMYRSSSEFLHYYEFWLDFEIRNRHQELSKAYYGGR